MLPRLRQACWSVLVVSLTAGALTASGAAPDAPQSEPAALEHVLDEEPAVWSAAAAGIYPLMSHRHGVRKASHRKASHGKADRPAAARSPDRRAVACLTLAGFAEARGEGAEGMRAVMWVILNRQAAAQPKPPVCTIVAKRAAFEAVGNRRFRKHVQAMRRNAPIPPVRPQDAVEARALHTAQHIAAEMAAGGRGRDMTRGATHFFSPVAQHALHRRPPAWSHKLVRTVSIGGHVFYVKRKPVRRRI